jgi:MoaE-MoaD fusion protein
MQVRILFFGVLKDVVGQASDAITLPERATVRDVLSHYQHTTPKLGLLLPAVALAVNQEYSSPDAPLKSGDEVAFLPPVSGGAAADYPNRDPRPARSPDCRAVIARERIDTATILESLKRAEDGAAIVFEGVVRNNSRGRQTLYLDYEAYESMALRQLQELAQHALDRFPIREVTIIHRVGRLAIGETSVLIVVASAHRAAAFDACRWAIDTLKRIVPIWKKEYFSDGAVWADGEPFPPEIPLAEGTPDEKPASK